MPDWFAPFLTTEGLLALLTLTALEIVLGIDNIVFIAVLCGKLPESKRLATGRIGIALAVVTRIMLLATIKWLVGLDKHPLFHLPLPEFMLAQPSDPTLPRITAHEFTAKDLVLLLGGLFLLYKSVGEIHGKMTGAPSHLPGDPAAGTVQVRAGAAGRQPTAVPVKPSPAATVASVIVQIMLIDIVFSIDSVITAAGMAKDLPVMIAAVILSAVVMVAFAGPVMKFIERFPTIKLLALAFLVLIGTMLVAESTGQHIPKGYIYFAMAFALGIEMLNIKVRSKVARHGAAPES